MCTTHGLLFVIGYFARVTSLAEVREQVLKYIPVLSRPMVMYQKDHPVIWTSAYIDIAVSSAYFLCIQWISKHL